MERELVGLLGAGLTSFASGFGIAVPVGAIDRGYTLIDVLSRESGPQVGALLNTMVQNLWLEWQRSGLSRETTQLHAGALPAIVELNRPPPEAFMSALRTGDGAGRLAANILEHARASGDIVRAGLDEGTAYLLFERLYRVILTDPATLSKVMVAVDLYLQTELWRTEPSAPPPAREQAAAPPAPAAEVQRTAAPPREPEMFSRLSGAAISAVQAGIAMRRPRQSDLIELEAELCQSLAVLIEQLVTLGQRTPEITTPLLDAARHLAGGAFVEADRAMTAAQEVMIHLAQSDLAAARKRMQLAAEVLSARATLEEIRLDFRKAARHCGAAVRGFTRADVSLQWHFLIRQAQALLRQDQLFDDPAALGEAIRTYDEAGQLDTQLVGPLAWAQGQQQFAEILVTLGHRNRHGASFLKAAYHAGLASNALASEHRDSEAIKMRLLQADALWHGGDAPGDLAALDGAAHAYRTALGSFARESGPERWTTAMATFGQVLLRLATLRNDPQLLVEAIERLRAAIQFADLSQITIDRTATETTLGRALLAEYAGGGQPLLLDLAATAFRRAIKSATAEQNMATKAELQHELGMTLWAMAERAGDKQSMSNAAEMLDASIASFASQGDDARADSVRADLARLRDMPLAASTAPVSVPQH